MGINELCALPVADLAAPDSALFLWATFPQLPEALRLIEAWGFTYKSVAFVWLKKNRKADSWFYGLGFWTRGNAEVCLLATRGHPKRQAANVHQFIISPIQEHSRKPEEAREKIVALMGDLPRVELFARQTPPGWDVCGATRWKAPSRTSGQSVQRWACECAYPGEPVRWDRRVSPGSVTVRYPSPVGQRDRGRPYLHHPAAFPGHGPPGGHHQTGRRGRPARPCADLWLPLSKSFTDWQAGGAGWGQIRPVLPRHPYHSRNEKGHQ